MTRLLLINYEFPPLGGGGGNASSNIARVLSREGSSVMVLTSKFRGLPTVEERDGYLIRRLPVIRRRMDRCSPLEMFTFMVAASIAAMVLARGWKPDGVIAFFGIPGGPPAWLMKRAFSIPYVISLRGGDVPGFQSDGLAPFHHLTKGITRSVWRDAKRVVANSWGLRHLALKTCPNLPIDVIPNGVDSTFFRPPAMRPSRVGTRLLFIGRLVSQKGIDTLLNAIKIIMGRCTVRVDLDIVGDGPARHALERMSSQNGLSETVRFHGWKSRCDLLPYYLDADVFILPSRDEGMPNVVLEAMSCALPVIATRVSGNQELVRDNETGRLVPPDDPHALAKAIEDLTQNGELCRKMGEEGRRLVEREYSWDRVAESYLGLFRGEDLVGVRPSPAETLPHMNNAG